MKEVKRILTHVSVDIDAVVSVWFALRFITKKETPIDFVPASWDGRGIKFDDLALDINAGGYGIKGRRDRSGKVHSCFKEIVQKYGGEETKEILRNLVIFVDRNDSGSMVDLEDHQDYPKGEIPFLSLSFALRSLQSFHKNNDEIVCRRMFEILDGMFLLNKRKQEDKKSFYSSIISVGKTAIVIKEDLAFSARNKLLKSGKYEAVIYVDGNNLGVLVKNNARADVPEVLEVVKKVGEEKEWFAHSAGYLYCRGCRKSPAQTPSKVDPYLIAKALEKNRRNSSVR
ncbi:MAG: hypothetical protein WC928_02125 [Patescibacteria group bacterium]|jgi:hypothetical protein